MLKNYVNSDQYFFPHHSLSPTTCIMKSLIILVLVVLISRVSSGQEQPFKSGFIFKAALLKDPGNQFFIVEEVESSQKIQIYPISDPLGKDSSDGKMFTTVTIKSIMPRSFDLNNFSYNSLRGIIKERNGDTLFFNLWPLKNLNSSDENLYPSVKKEEETKTYALVIGNWHTTGREYQVKDIPFRNRQFIAANFPVRVNPKNGEVKSGFTNASISYNWIFGHARIYRSNFIEPRIRSWGIGPMIGVGTRTRDDDEKEDITATGGFSIIGSMYGVKLLLAAGFERGFNSHSRNFTPFIGFGFGIDIYSLVDPEIKRKE